MKEVDSSGDLVFSSTELGSGSVKKTAQIAEVLKKLLTEVVVVTRSEDNNLLLQKYYDKLEINNILTGYTTLEKLSAEVEKKLEELIKDPSLSKFALKEDLDALNEVVKGYSNTLETIKGNQTALVSSWQEYKNGLNETITMQNTSINNLSTNYASLSSSVNNLQTILNNLDLINIANFSAQVSDIQSKLAKMETAVGNLANLKTSAKGNLVAAINELVDKQGTLSSLKTSNKNSLVAAINELFQSASEGKSKIADAITGKGVPASATDSYATLANKISSISTGVNTSDANITAADVTLGKIGYGRSGRIVGEHSCSGGE